MKKVLTLVLALMLSVCLAVPAFAAESITDGVSAPTLGGNGGGTLQVSTPTQSLDNPKGVLADLGVTVAADQTATVVYLHDLTVDGGSYPNGYPVTFTVSGVDANDKVIVLHGTGSSWEKVDEITGKTTFTVTFKTLSPVALVKVSVPNPAPSTPGTSGGTSAPTAPQTGAPMAVPFIGLAVIALAGIVAFKARKKEM